MRLRSAHLLTIGKRMQIIAARCGRSVAEHHGLGHIGAELQLVLDELRARSGRRRAVVAMSLMRSITTSWPRLSK